MRISLYLSSFLLLFSCSQEKTCKDFHNGKFGYTSPEYSHIEITRNGNSQVEINTKTKIEAQTSVKWISDCNYILSYEEFKNAPEELNSMIGQKIEAEIIEIGIDKFTCEVKTKNYSDTMEFRIIK